MRKVILPVLISIIFLPSLLIAQKRSDDKVKYGDWDVFLSVDKKDLIAATSQDDDKYLAYRCFTNQGKCAHVLVTATACSDGHNYPVLINSSAGSLMVNCTCSNNNGNYELIPTDWEQFHRILTEGTGYIGFAIPLESGQFKVVRFSLYGAKDALSSAEYLVRKKDSAEYK